VGGNRRHTREHLLSEVVGKGGLIEGLFLQLDGHDGSPVRYKPETRLSEPCEECE
jgi:hypothetical protein